MRSMSKQIIETAQIFTMEFKPALTTSTNMRKDRSWESFSPVTIQHFYDQIHMVRMLQPILFEQTYTKDLSA